MTFRMRSKRRRKKVVQNLSERGEGAASEEAETEFGPRVFLLRSPPEGRMPKVARRSTTRVFVPKATVAKNSENVKFFARVLRSGKRFDQFESLEKDEDGESGGLDDVRWLTTEGNKGMDSSVPESDGNGNGMESLQPQRKGNMYDIVYNRKRPRTPSIGWIGLESCPISIGKETRDPRFGVVFSRNPNQKRHKTKNEPGKSRDGEMGHHEKLVGKRKGCLQIKEPTRSFLEANNVALELWACSSDPLVLVLLLDSPSSGSILSFQKLLISAISWLRRGTTSLCGFAAYLLSEPMGTVFPRHGIHFLPLASSTSNFLVGRSISTWGICRVYNTGESPLPISLNFAALPSYFKGLHLAAHLGSPNLLFALTRKAMFLIKKLFVGFQSEHRDSHVPMETESAGTMLSASVSPLVNGNGLDGSAKKATLVAQSHEVLQGSTLSNQQRRRTSLRLSKGRTASSIDCHGSLWSNENLSSDPLVDPLSLGNSFGCHSHRHISTSPLTYSKLKKTSKRSHGELTKELKSILSEIKQNIDSVHCSANVLVTAGDRCWREEGAEVFLELSSARDWCLAVKLGGSLRYLHRPRDMKYTLNRYTHAYMWIGDDGWSLEFFDRREWLTFKELLAECRQRNVHREDTPLKSIPVPVFREVSVYENVVTSNFERPEQYICMKHGDEIFRATVNEVPYYDMDSEDEAWLIQHNSSSNLEKGTSSLLSDETFEKMIFSFEKDAYYCPSDVPLLASKPVNQEEVEYRKMVEDVYDYWLKKRKRRHGPLARVFQGLSIRRPPLTQRHVLRKRRSLKRQRSQVGRGKPPIGFDPKTKDAAREEALRNVCEAQQAWERSVEVAVPLRQRAQLLMENADLAAYKSTMALRIAEAIGSSSSSAETVSFILDNLPEV